MPDPGSGERNEVRAAEVAAALSLATDLGMGFPLEHGLHGTLLAAELAERLDVGPEVAREAYYLSLLMYAGCTADAELAAELFQGGLTKHFVPFIRGTPRQAVTGMVRAIPEADAGSMARLAQVARRLPRAAQAMSGHQRALCEVGEMLAGRLGVPAPVASDFRLLTDRWDGRGGLRRAAGEELPMALRIAQVARDASHQQLLHGPDGAVAILRERAGVAFDPAVVACVTAEVLAHCDGSSIMEEVLAAEPEPHLRLTGEGIDSALGAMGDFADLGSPFLTGHSAGVADLAGRAAACCGLDAVDVTAVRRAALVHDVGRVAVSAGTWQAPRALTVDEWEQVRLHPYHGERVLSRSRYLAALGAIGGAHHERLDGSGYHRGVAAATLGAPARVLAAADAYHAMTEPRPHRPQLTPGAAADELGRQVHEGRMDATAVAGVLDAAGQAVPPLERPCGLTEREAEVLGLLARGRQTKQVAQVLGISAKTADRHVQNAYSKIGVSTRAAAALFAMEHGLVAWGELPMGRQGSAP